MRGQQLLGESGVVARRWSDVREREHPRGTQRATQRGGASKGSVGRAGSSKAAPPLRAAGLRRRRAMRGAPCVAGANSGGGWVGKELGAGSAGQGRARRRGAVLLFTSAAAAGRGPPGGGALRSLPAWGIISDRIGAAGLVGQRRRCRAAAPGGAAAAQPAGGSVDAAAAKECHAAVHATVAVGHGIRDARHLLQLAQGGGGGGRPVGMRRAGRAAAGARAAQGGPGHALPESSSNCKQTRKASAPGGRWEGRRRRRPAWGWRRRAGRPGRRRPCRPGRRAPGTARPRPPWACLQAARRAAAGSMRHAQTLMQVHQRVLVLTAGIPACKCSAPNQPPPGMPMPPPIMPIPPMWPWPPMPLGSMAAGGGRGTGAGRAVKPGRAAQRGASHGHPWTQPQRPLSRRLNTASVAVFPPTCGAHGQGVEPRGGGQHEAGLHARGRRVGVAPPAALEHFIAQGLQRQRQRGGGSRRLSAEACGGWQAAGSSQGSE